MSQQLLYTVDFCNVVNLKCPDLHPCGSDFEHLSLFWKAVGYLGIMHLMSLRTSHSDQIFKGQSVRYRWGWALVLGWLQPAVKLTVSWELQLLVEFRSFQRIKNQHLRSWNLWKLEDIGLVGQTQKCRHTSRGQHWDPPHWKEPSPDTINHYLLCLQTEPNSTLLWEVPVSSWPNYMLRFTAKH